MTMEDFRDWDVLDVKFENNWVVLYLAGCRLKFRNWKAE